MHPLSLRGAAALACAFALAGCATVAPDAGHADVQALARARLGEATRLPTSDAASAAQATQDLLAAPLTSDAAVQVALLHNPALAARLAELRIGAADVVQAQRLPNPRFAFGNKRNADVTTLDRTVMVSVLSLLTMPLATDIAQRQFEAHKLAAAGDVLRLAHATRRAWIEAVASEEAVRYHEKIVLAADAARDLAQRMEQAGNFSALARMREEAFAIDAAARLTQARLAAALARERLARNMGLDPARTFTLPSRLPDPPSTPLAESALARALPEDRLDILAARRSTDAVATRVGLTRATRFVNVLEVGYINESQTGESRQNGYEIEIEIPLFDWGDAKLARAEAEYAGSVERLRSTVLVARSELRASYAAYAARYELARRYRSEVVPLRQRISEENLLRYNAMQIGVFTLLADARATIDSVLLALDAQRDFWLADADLAMATKGVSLNPSEPARMTTASNARSEGGH